MNVAVLFRAKAIKLNVASLPLQISVGRAKPRKVLAIRQLPRQLAGMDRASPEMPEGDEYFREKLRIRKADRFYQRIERRLQGSPVRVKEINEGT